MAAEKLHQLDDEFGAFLDPLGFEQRLFGGGVGANASAIGNQLNVNVSGQWNTVIVNSTQINNGDINASATAQGNVSTDNDQD